MKMDIPGGETDLSKLIAGMEAKLHDGEYVFLTFKDKVQILEDEVIAMVKEEEGVTYVISREYADLCSYPYKFVSSWITLEVHSSLEAVGLTAAFSNALATSGISCNVIAGYYHDHIFVESRQASEAMTALKKLQLGKK